MTHTIMTSVNKLNGGNYRFDRIAISTSDTEEPTSPGVTLENVDVILTGREMVLVQMSTLRKRIFNGLSQAPKVLGADRC